MAKTCFIMLMPGRTGSSYLVSCLRKHPQISVEGEQLVALKSSEEQLRWIERFYGRRQWRKRACGFKTKLKDVKDLTLFHDTLCAYSTRIVLVLRRDPFRQAVSVLNARRLMDAYGVWNRDVSLPDLGPIEVDIERLDAELKEVERRNLELDVFSKTLKLSTIKVYYEDLFVPGSSEVWRVQEFLGVVPRELVGDTKKTTPRDLSKAVANHSAIVAHYKNTPYEEFLVES